MEKFTDEQRDFLLSKTRTAKVATTRKDGSPHVTPAWFELDGSKIIFTTGGTSIKAKNLRRDPRVCICIDDETPPFAYIQIRGTVTFIEDQEALLHWATRIGGRYMGQDKAEEYGKRNGVEGELLVQVTPTHVIFEKNIAS
nr:PPOX class F420-dependent oxidoreductase [Ktedonosporobacter rubrisoli]